MVNNGMVYMVIIPWFLEAVNIPHNTMVNNAIVYHSINIMISEAVNLSHVMTNNTIEDHSNITMVRHSPL